jgi:hypothetical protein
MAVARQLPGGASRPVNDLPPHVRRNTFTAVMIFAFCWRAAIVLSSTAGLLSGDHRVAYFTVQSNLIVIGYFGAALYWMARRKTALPPAPRLRGPITFWLMVTCLVTFFLLDDGANPLPGLVHGTPYDLMLNRSLFLLHYVTPAMILIDFLALKPRAASPWRDLWLWILYPLGYGIVILIRGILLPLVPDRYPYFFLNPAESGWDGTAMWFGLLLVALSLLAAALLALDRLLSRLTSHPTPPSPSFPAPTSSDPAEPLHSAPNP